MEIEPTFALDQQPDVERCCAHRLGRVGAEERRRKLRIEDRSDCERRQALLDVGAECAEHLVCEEPIQRLGTCSTPSSISADDTLASPITAGQPFARVTRPDAESSLRSTRTSAASRVVHRERGLVHLQHLAVEPMLRRHPGRPHAARDQELHWRDRDERVDEVLGLRLLRDLVVVVDDEPRVGRPRRRGPRRGSRRASGRSRQAPGSARMCVRSRTSQSSTIAVALFAIPSASAATSVDDERAVYQCRADRRARPTARPASSSRSRPER